MKMKKVLVTIPVTEKHQDMLENISASLTFTYSGEEEVTPKMVRDANIILGNVPPSYIGASKKLELLQCSSAGVGLYVVPGVVSPDTLLCNSTGAYGLAISEHMIAMILELIKNLNKYYQDQKQHAWKDEDLSVPSGARTPSSWAPETSAPNLPEECMLSVRP